MNGLQSFYKQLSMEVAAALAECRERPYPKHVHQLRTSTRRLEAVISVARSESPKAKLALHAMNKVLVLLRKIRRAAGEVRDADIQQKIIAAISGDLLKRHRGKPRSEILKEIDDLRKNNKKRRKVSEKALVDVLASAESQLQKRLQTGEKALTDLPSIKTTPHECAVQWIRSKARGTRVSQKRLHDFRKDTKGARYLAELRPASASSANLAKRLHSMHDAIGDWHDYELMTVEAKASIGRKALLTEAVRAHRDQTKKHAVASVTSFKRYLARLLSNRQATQ